jgi:ABC-type phosphate transport system substrate-binding protein
LDKTRTRHRTLTAVVVVTVALAAGCQRSTQATAPPAGDSSTVVGAGATFPAPIYEQWFGAFPRTGEGYGAQVR